LNFASVIAGFIAYSYALYYDCRLLQFTTTNNFTIHNEAPGNVGGKKITEFILTREWHTQLADIHFNCKSR
jgi:hypothetical protein